MPASVVRLEGFRYHGHLVMYFGPFPSLLRLPTAALTHSLDGRTARIAMLVAFVVAMIAAGHLLWQPAGWFGGRLRGHVAKRGPRQPRPSCSASDPA